MGMGEGGSTGERSAALVSGWSCTFIGMFSTVISTMLSTWCCVCRAIRDLVLAEGR